MDERKISVVVHTYNEERVLADTLNYLKDFDEILVCDMQSTDATLEIAKRYNCTILSVPKSPTNMADPERNHAIHATKYEWVLVVDADEIIPQALKEYLYDYIKNPNCADGLFIARKNYLMNVWVKNSYPDYQLRFFKKSKTTWPPYVHSKPVVEGRVEKIPQASLDLAMIHKSMTLFTKINKMNIYTTNEIEKRKGERVSMPKIIFSCFFRFIKHYIFKGGIFQGMSGLILAVNEANYKFYTLAKIWEHNNEEKNIKGNRL